MQNNFQHYSDLSEYTVFKPSGTDWPSSVSNVQKALSMIGSWSRKDVGLPTASPTTRGIAAVASQQEVDTGKISDKFVSPATLKSTITRPDATTTVKGLSRYATNAEAAAFALSNAAIVPASLGHVFTTITGNQTRFGTVKFATPQMGKAGTDDTTAVTPKRVVEMIGTHSANPPAYTPATDTNLGLVKLATSAQIQQGTIGDGYAISPKGLLGAKASESKYGVIRLATSTETSAGSLNSVAVSPKNLMSLRGSVNQYGLVQLSGTSQGGQTAARADSVVFKTTTVNGKSLSGNISLGAGDVGAWTKSQSDDRYMPKNTSTGNVTRVATVRRGYDNRNDWWETDSPWEAGSHASISVSIKFEPNHDGGDNRVAWFDLYVAGNFRQRIQMNIENHKSGSRGHSWRFEGFATCFEGFDTSAQQRVSLRPAGGFERVREWSAQIIYCTN